MLEELEVLRIISERLRALDIPFMLTGSKEANSELQCRDVKTLLNDTLDRAYLDHWAQRLGVAHILQDLAG